jgi:mannosyltransferase OCH1-like enzyme
LLALLTQFDQLVAIDEHDQQLIIPNKPNDKLIFENPEVNDSPKQTIPKTIWLTMKRFPHPLPKHITTFQNLNPDFTFQFINDSSMQQFMETTFPDTSLLWAFNLIHPKVGAAKADILRMAVLWNYGCCYIDFDSYFTKPLSSVINFDQDELIISIEDKNWFNNFYDSSIPFAVPDPDHYFKHRLVIQWALCSRRYHPFLTRYLYNVIQSIKLLYYHKKYLLIEKFPEKWFEILYATGPGLWTASIIDELKHHPKLSGSYRLIDADFASFGGVFKALDNHDKHHYFSTLRQHHFLKNYWNISDHSPIYQLIP